MAGSSLPPNAMNMIKGFVGDAPAPAPPPPATSLPPKAMDMIKGFLPPAALLVCTVCKAVPRSAPRVIIVLSRLCSPSLILCGLGLARARLIA